jgi:hypothetical protein
MPAGEIANWIASWRPDGTWLNRPAISRDDLPILFAMVEHRAWVAALLGHLHEAQESPPLDPRECRFGQWLDVTGKLRYASHPALEQVFALHESIHRAARQLLAGRSRSNPPSGAEIAEIEDLRDRLIAQLRRLIG